MRKLSGVLIALLILSVSLTIPFQYMASSQIVGIRQDKITRNPDGSLEFKTDDNDKTIVSYDKSPKLKIERWGEEAYMQITANFTGAPPIIEQDKIRMVDDDYEVLIYDLPPSDLFEYGGVEYEIILKSKPIQNYITMPIETKNLVYHYQPLIPEKDSEYRDERFAGSYAVYHVNKKDNEYKTGKAFHILRPILIDALGDEIYADILIEKDVLKITMNQTWLDKAVYPVIIDPTFGKTTIGASTRDPDQERLRATRAVLTELASTMTLFWYQFSYNAGEIRFAIYNQSLGGRPVNVMNDTIKLTPVAGQWNNVSLQVNLTAGTYYLAFWANATWTSSRLVYDVVAGNTTAFGGIQAWNGFPDPFPFVLWTTREHSIYVEYDVIVVPTFFLTSLFHTGIANIDVNGTQTSNLTETEFNQSEIALSFANAESGFSFLYWDNENVSHIHDITVTKTMTANSTVTAFAIAVGGDGGVAGVSMLLFALLVGFAVIVLIVASRKR